MQCKVDVILDAINDEHRKNLTATNKANGELGSEDLVEVLFRLKESSELDFPKTNDNIIAVIFVRLKTILCILPFPLCYICV